MSEEAELLRAQLVTCTTAMRKAINVLEGEGARSIAVAAIDLLKRARSEPVAIEAFREGEWQRAKQEAEALGRQLNAAKQQLEITQRALVEEREKNSYPNSAVDELKTQVKAGIERETSLLKSRTDLAAVASELREHNRRLIVETRQATERADVWRSRCDKTAMREVEAGELLDKTREQVKALAVAVGWVVNE